MNRNYYFIDNSSGSVNILKREADTLSVFIDSSTFSAKRVAYTFPCFWIQPNKHAFSGNIIGYRNLPEKLFNKKNSIISYCFTNNQEKVYSKNRESDDESKGCQTFNLIVKDLPGMGFHPIQNPLYITVTSFTNRFLNYNYI